MFKDESFRLWRERACGMLGVRYQSVRFVCFVRLGEAKSNAPSTLLIALQYTVIAYSSNRR